MRLREIGAVDLVDLMTRLPEPSPATAFDGNTYNPERDHHRLKGQLADVFHLMSDGQWRTLEVIGLPLNIGDASVSARLRDLRKAKYGSHTVERRHVRAGLFEYCLIVNPTENT
jgi:hypothetical protein